jgi:hypothetical protein
VSHTTDNHGEKQEAGMPDDAAKVRRTLLLRLKAPTADAAEVLGAMMKNTASLYKAFGEAKVRLLRNADDRTQFLQIVEFEADATVERSRQKIASEPAMQNFLQAWRALFPNGAEAEVYEEVGG